jgi:hypothetical protein
VGGGGGLVVQEGLENECGGHLVHDFAVLLTGVTGLVEDLVSLPGGEALVPHMDGQTGEGAEFGGKGLGFERAGTEVAGEMEGIADHDSHHAEAACEAGQGAEVLAGVVAPLQGENGLRGEPELVRDGHADAFGPNVETKIAGVGGGIQIQAPSLRA